MAVRFGAGKTQRAPKSCNPLRGCAPSFTTCLQGFTPSQARGSLCRLSTSGIPGFWPFRGASVDSLPRGSECSERSRAAHRATNRTAPGWLSEPPIGQPRPDGPKGRLVGETRDNQSARPEGPQIPRPFRPPWCIGKSTTTQASRRYAPSGLGCHLPGPSGRGATSGRV